MNTNPAVDSIKMAMDEFLKGLLESNSVYLKERASDLIDIRDHIIRNLVGSNDLIIDDKCILCLDEIYPSILINNLDKIIGIIAKRGGFTSHSAIICRNNDIPYVLEINTSPGMTETSDLPAQASAMGISYDELVQLILNSAGLNK